MGRLPSKNRIGPYDPGAAGILMQRGRRPEGKNRSGNDRFAEDSSTLVSKIRFACAARRMSTVSAPEEVPATAMTGTPGRISPASAAITAISTQTLTPWPTMRSASAITSAGLIPPYFFEMPRSTPLNAKLPVQIL